MTNLLSGTTGFGKLGLELTNVQIRNQDGTDSVCCACGDTLEIDVEARAKAAIKRPNLGYALIAKSGDLLFSVGILNHGFALADLTAGQTCRAVFKVTMNLAPGTYSLSVMAADNHEAVDGNSGVHHDTRERVIDLVVTASPTSDRFDGVGALPLALEHALVS